MNAQNLSVRLPATYAEQLAKFAIGYESPSQTAKRLLMEFLDGRLNSLQSPPPISGDFGDRLSAIEDQLEELENRAVLEPEDLDRISNIVKTDLLAQIGNRLEKIELRQLESQDFADDAYWSDYGERITKLEKAIAQLSQPETAILIEKKTRRKIKEA